MNEPDHTEDEISPGPSTGTVVAGKSARPFDALIGRLQSMLGLRPAGSMRDDLADVLAADDARGGFSASERELLANILRLREARVEDIMVPRADIEAVEIGTSLDRLFRMFHGCGHSRMPVYRESLDDPVGLVHIKDLMGLVADRAAPEAADSVAGDRADGDGANGDGGDAKPTPEPLALDRVDLSRSIGDSDLVRRILFVPPSMPVSMLLANMQAARTQMALVIDEYGGTDGLVSLEDAIETVVGDIEDEHDDESVAMVVPDGEGGFLADARADLDEVSATIGADLKNGHAVDDVDTIGGLVFNLTGRVPVRGELVAAASGFEIEVLDADPRRIKRLRITRRPAGWRADLRRRPKAAAEQTGTG